MFPPTPQIPETSVNPRIRLIGPPPPPENQGKGSFLGLGGGGGECMERGCPAVLFRSSVLIVIVGPLF